jgi:catabolite regulation protein CreA
VVLTHSTATPPLPACQVFTEKKGLNIFKDKTLRVRRIYDSSRQSLVYVAYSTRLSNAADEKTMSSGRYRTSVCALQLPGQQTSSSGALASAPAVAAGVQ